MQAIQAIPAQRLKFLQPLLWCVAQLLWPAGCPTWKGEAMAAMQDIMQELCSTYSVGYDALQDALQDICIFKSKLGKNGIWRHSTHLCDLLQHDVPVLECKKTTTINMLSFKQLKAWRPMEWNLQSHSLIHCWKEQIPKHTGHIPHWHWCFIGSSKPLHVPAHVAIMHLPLKLAAKSH